MNPACFGLLPLASLPLSLPISHVAVVSSVQQTRMAMYNQPRQLWMCTNCQTCIGNQRYVCSCFQSRWFSRFHKSQLPASDISSNFSLICWRQYWEEGRMEEWNCQCHVHQISKDLRKSDCGAPWGRGPAASLGLLVLMAVGETYPAEEQRPQQGVRECLWFVIGCHLLNSDCRGGGPCCRPPLSSWAGNGPSAVF